MKKITGHIVLFATLISGYTVTAQSHSKGDINLSLGVSMGGYATEWTAEQVILGIPFKVTDTDGAASVTYPIQFQYGLSDRFSLGLNVEPGSYLDSSDTKRNSIWLVSVQPRYFIINGNKVNWFVNADLGVSVLTWKSSEDNEDITKGYNAFFWRLGTGMNWYFANKLGMYVSGSFGRHGFTLNRLEVNGDSGIPSGYTEKLTVVGGQFNIGLTYRL